MRLDKFVCKSTTLTKLDAIACIHAGQVTVNHKAILSEVTQVHENNTVCLNEQVLTLRPFRYLLLHKTQNTICSNVDEGYPSIFNDLELENINELHVAGRLDADTTGLVLITDDGRWSFDIIRPTQKCEKVYRVGLSRPISADKEQSMIERFAQGIQLQGEDSLTLPATLDMMNETEVLLTIVEGKYHQVKRMFAAVGNKVVSLHRERIGNVNLDVELGQWRYLTQDEIESF
ncbi:pseudouridine synthase [Pseudomonas sp. HK3]